MSLLLLYQSGQSVQYVTASSIVAAGSAGSFIGSTISNLNGVAGSGFSNPVAITADAPGVTVNSVSAAGQATFGSTTSDASKTISGASGAGTASFGSIRGDASPSIFGVTTAGIAAPPSSTRSDAQSALQGSSAIGIAAVGSTQSDGNATIIGTTGTAIANALSSRSDAQSTIIGQSASGLAQSPSTGSDAAPIIIGTNATGSVTAALATAGEQSTGTTATSAVAPLGSQLYGGLAGSSAIGIAGFAAGSSDSTYQTTIQGVVGSGSSALPAKETDAALLGTLASAIAASLSLAQIALISATQGSATSGTLNTTSTQQVVISAIQSAANLGTFGFNQMTFLSAASAAFASSGSVSTINPGGTKAFMLPQGGVGSASFGILSVKITKTSHGYRKAGRGAMNTTSISRKQRQRTHAEEMRLLLQKMQQQAEVLKAELAATKTTVIGVPPLEPEIIIDKSLPVELPIQQAQREASESNVIEMTKQIQFWKDIAQQEDAWLLGEESESDEVLLGIL